jgi:hypothetical protein
MSEYEGLRSFIYVADIQMKQKIANSPFFDRLYHPDRPVIVFDGAMGSNLQLQTSPPQTLVARNTKAATNALSKPNSNRLPQFTVLS